MNLANLNRLRAAVLGANDGIISVATALIALLGVLDGEALLLSAIAITLAGAVSMAAGEYVSVGAQRAAEQAAQASHLTSPLQAALSSFLAFAAGALIPASVAVLTHNAWFVCGGVLVSLVVTAALSSPAGQRGRGLLRMLLVGSVALAVSLLANHILGAIAL